MSPIEDRGASPDHPEVDPALRFIGAGTPMRERVRTHSWQRTPLGAIADWSPALRTVVGIVMHSAHPMFLWWGAQLTQIYNDAYVPCFGEGKHPAALGQGGRECWPEIWPIIGPQIESLLRGGQSQWHEDKLVPIWRNGRLEDVYWSYTYTPVYDGTGTVQGVLVVCTETTARVLAARRRDTLAQLNRELAACASATEVFAHARMVAHGTPHDILALRSGAPGAGEVGITGLQLNMNLDLALSFTPSPRLPLDGAYHQFLEQFTAAVGNALLRLEGDAALRLARAERDRLLLDAPVGTMVLVGADLVVELANHAYCELIGRPAGDVIGRPFAELFPDLTGSVVHENFRDVYASGLPFVSGETLVRFNLAGRGPVERYFIYNLAPLRRLDATVYGLMAIAIDVTQQVMARHEIERLNLDLHRSARAKDEFLAMLGHELRNPLAPIVTALKLLKLKNRDGGFEVAIMQRQLDHLVRLVDDLLDISRITSGKVELREEVVRLDQVLSNAIEMASPLLEQKKHRLEVRVPPIEWQGDPARLAQVVSNLLNNAGRYTPERGRISLQAEQQDGQLQIRVSDNGQGISPHLLPVIFDLFVQGERRVDQARGGLGIGLALVKNLIQMHGGTVSADSDGEGRGSTFTIALPYRVRAPEPAATSWWWMTTRMRPICLATCSARSVIRCGSPMIRPPRWRRPSVPCPSWPSSI